MRKILFLSIAAALILLAVTAATPNTASAYGPTNYYVVRPGDTLDWIAQRYGVSSWSLARANGIWNPNYIYVGQTLVIPGGYFPPAPNPCPWPGSCPPIPKPHPQPYGCSYVVRWGDSMQGIAWRYGLDVWTLARANNIYNLNWIYAGQWLRIPNCRW
jgi:LysM repeat protein